MTETAKRIYNDGDIICLQGETAENFYILRSGKINVIVNLEENEITQSLVKQSGKQIAELSTEGSIFGEAGLFLGRRTASLRALQNGTQLEEVQLSAGGVQGLVKNNPNTGLTFCRSLAGRLRDLSDQIRIASFAVMSVHSTYNSLSLALVNLVKKMEENLSAGQLVQLIASIKEFELYKAGEAIRSQRQETRTIFDSELARRRAGTVNLPQGTELCREGDIGRGLYLVKSGELEVRIAGRKVATVEAGELVGEIAVLLKEQPKRTASIKALVDSKLVGITAVDFNKTAFEHPGILISLGQVMSRRIAVTNRMIVDLESAVGKELRLLSESPQSCQAVFSKIMECLPKDNSEFVAIRDFCIASSRRAENASIELKKNNLDIINRMGG